MRYFFRTEDGRCYPDDEGTELAGVQEACVAATESLGEFLRDKPKAFWDTDCLDVQVSDETGLILFTLHLSVSLSPAMNGRHPAI